MEHMITAKKYLKYIKRIASKGEVVIRIDPAGCVIRETDGIYCWSFFREYRSEKTKHAGKKWSWAANDTQ